MNQRIVCHFSCGAASAVATKLILQEYASTQVVIYNAFIKEEHPDNRRFLKECEEWFGHPITVLEDSKYDASVHEVWRKKRFLANGIWGAPCSVHLKRDVLDAHCLDTDVHVFGYTFDERERVERWTKSNGEKVGLFPLVDAQLTHADCLSLVARAGIELPAMYKLGYNNANCIGCCKGGEGYWNKIKVDFPEVFEQVVQIQESIGPGAYIFRNRKTGVRFGLKDLNPEAGRHKTELPSCSFVCERTDEEFQDL